MSRKSVASALHIEDREIRKRMNTKNNQNSRRSLLLITLVVVIFSVVNPQQVYAVEGDKWSLVGETVPDGTCFTPNSTVTKSFTLKNAGSGAWSPQYSFDFASGTQMGGIKQYMPANVGVNNTVTITLNLTAPSNPGEYKGYWSLKDGGGNIVKSTRGSESMWVWIKVAVNCNQSQIQPTQSSSSLGVTLSAGTPKPNELDYYEKNNAGYLYLGGVWITSTPVGPNKKMVIPGGGSITIYTFTECSMVWVSTGFLRGKFEERCSERSRGVADLGMLPVISVDREGQLAFYKYLNTVTFNTFGALQGNTLVWKPGFTIYEIGRPATANIGTYLARVSAPVLIIGFVVYASKVYVITRPVTPVPVPLPPLNTLGDLNAIRPNRVYQRLATLIPALTTQPLQDLDLGIAFTRVMQAQTKVVSIVEGVNLTIETSACISSMKLDINLPSLRRSLHGIGQDPECNGGWAYVDALTQVLNALADLIEELKASGTYAAIEPILTNAGTRLAWALRFALGELVLRGFK